MKDLKIEFVLYDKVGDVEVTPEAIPLSKFTRYNKQVQDFIKGSENLLLDDVSISVGSGSYKLTAVIPAALSATLAANLVSLQHPDSWGEVDSKRVGILAQWQNESKRFPHQRYVIRAQGSSIKPMEINQHTDFKPVDGSPWIQMEQYLVGTVVDMGGANEANIHLRRSDSGELIVLSTNQKYLKSQEQNWLYREVLAHAFCDLHTKTGEIRNYQLISLEPYAPKYDLAALDRFAEQGRLAWADVPDAVAWVRKLRGGS